MRRSGVRIPLAPPQADIRSRMSVFYMPVRVGVMPVAVLLGTAGVPGTCWAGLRRGWRPAREPSAPRASLGASPRSPARPRHRPRAPQPGSLAPCGPSGALRTGDAWLLMCGLVRRFEARPGLATAHGHRSQVLLRPAVPPASSTADCCRSPVWLATHVKPSSPLPACALSPVKPTTPLQAGYTCFCCYFIEQRRRGFHTGVLRFPHWC